MKKNKLSKSKTFWTVTVLTSSIDWTIEDFEKFGTDAIFRLMFPIKVPSRIVGGELTSTRLMLVL